MSQNRNLSSQRARRIAMFRMWQKDRYCFGGSLKGASHPKKKRAFRKNLAMHVVLKSSLARGSRSLLAHNLEVTRILQEECKRRFITLHHAANAGTHLHLLMQAPSAAHFNTFLRIVSGRIAMLVTGSRKGAPLATDRRFWDARPFVRLLARQGQSFINALAYISMNATETAGFSRHTVKRMFREIREALRLGLLPRSPELLAAGFV